jgi:hypothetical protein
MNRRQFLASLVITPSVSIPGCLTSSESSRLGEVRVYNRSKSSVPVSSYIQKTKKRGSQCLQQEETANNSKMVVDPGESVVVSTIEDRGNYRLALQARGEESVWCVSYPEQSREFNFVIKNGSITFTY